MKQSKTLIVLIAILVANTSECLAAEVIQSGNGPCPINIANVSGTVRVESSGCFDERVIKPLLDTINRQDRNFQQKAREVDGWIKRYFDLQERLGIPGAFSKLREEARAQFQANNLQGATTTKQKIIEEQESVVDQVAADYFDLAELLVLQLKPLEAQPYYAKAFRYRPEMPRYSEAYARSLCDSNQRKKAVEVYELSIKELRQLALVDPIKYASSLACTLADLTGLLFSNGDFKAAYEASLEGLKVARTIEPKDSEKALEHTADAMVGMGISQARLGELAAARDSLEAAEKLYSGIGVTNSNRPAISEALASIALQQSNREEEEHERKRTFDLEQEVMVASSPYLRRSRLVDSVLQLSEFYWRQGNLDKANSSCRELSRIASRLPQADKATVEFLLNAELAICGDLLLRAGKLDEADGKLRSSIQRFGQNSNSLRPRENRWPSMALRSLGWLQMLREQYEEAIASFDASIQLIQLVNDEATQRVTSDRRVAQFFAVDFPAAARDFLAHADDLPEAERQLWDFFVRRRTEPESKLTSALPSADDQFMRIVMSVSAGLLPKGSLPAAGKLAEAEASQERKCKRLFFVGELMLLLGDKQDGINHLQKCTPVVRGSLYPWIMKAEALKWSSRGSNLFPAESTTSRN